MNENWDDESKYDHGMADEGSMLKFSRETEGQSS